MHALHLTHEGLHLYVMPLVLQGRHKSLRIAGERKQTIGR